MIEQLDDMMTAKALYNEVLKTSNMFLHNSKHYAIELIKDEDPTYAEIAELMRKTAVIIRVVADEFDPMLGQKAEEYCELMTKMGVAIGECNKLDLKLLVAELERRPGL